MRCHGPAAFLCLALALLTACDRRPAIAPTDAPATQAPAPAAATPVPVADASVVPPASATPAQACPDADFDAFLKRFESGIDAQRVATADPLTMSSIDTNAQPEPAPVTRQVPRAQVQFPVMADAAARQAEGSALRVQDTLAKTQRVVVVSRPDSGAQVRFVFDALPCWTLTAVHDDSL